MKLSADGELARSTTAPAVIVIDCAFCEGPKCIFEVSDALSFSVKVAASPVLVPNVVVEFPDAFRLEPAFHCCTPANVAVPELLNAPETLSVPPICKNCRELSTCATVSEPPDRL